MTVLQEASCTVDGEAQYTCSVCGYSYKGPLRAPGHQYTTYTISPTCMENGYTSYTCEYCGDHYDGDIIPAYGHRFVNGICTICGQTQ